MGKRCGNSDLAGFGLMVIKWRIAGLMILHGMKRSTRQTLLIHFIHQYTQTGTPE